MVCLTARWALVAKGAGASFLRLDGSVWSTDKDGLIPSLLAAEMTARSGRDHYQLYQKMTEVGQPFSTRVDAKATPQQKALLGKLSPEQVKSTHLAGEAITRSLAMHRVTTRPSAGSRS